MKRLFQDRPSIGLRLLSRAACIFWLALSPTSGRGAEPSWDRAAAASRLDSREVWWAQWERASRDPETTCVACHTGVPFALARPALDRENPGAAYDALLANVRRRVKLWQTDEPYYDFKQEESRGTEAVVNALVLASDDRRRGLPGPSDETKAALDHLWESQRQTGERKGSWPWLQFGDSGYEPWESRDAEYYGTTLAALAIGLTPGGPQGAPPARLALMRDYLQKFFERWSEDRPQSSFNRIGTLWASTALDGLLTPQQQADLITEVFSKQRDDGGWVIASLGDWKRKDDTPQVTAPDGYATGLAVYVLRQARVSADDPRIKRGVAWLEAHQEAQTGAWPGYSVHKARSPSHPAWEFPRDAATAFAVLALSKAH